MHYKNETVTLQFGQSNYKIRARASHSTVINGHTVTNTIKRTTQTPIRALQVGKTAPPLALSLTPSTVLPI